MFDRYRKMKDREDVFVRVEDDDKSEFIDNVEMETESDEASGTAC